jgi:hypothetical protein
MDSEIAATMKEMLELLKKRADAQDEFQLRILEELRHLNRTLEGMQRRATVGDL